MQNKSCSTTLVDPKTVLLSYCLSLGLSVCLPCLSLLHSFDMKVSELYSAVAVLVSYQKQGLCALCHMISAVSEE